MVVVGWIQLVTMPEVTVAKVTVTANDVCCVVVTVEPVTLVYPAGTVSAGSLNTVEVVFVVSDVGIGVGPTPAPVTYLVEH